MWPLYQGLITICLAIFLVNLVLNLRVLHRLGSEKRGLPKSLPFISILIPARNEESDIITCLESLRGQDYPNYEILVLDDESSDDTAGVVERVAAVDPRVRLIRGKPLAEGWTGKSFACQQLASEARGSWLLFTDADTIHAPEMLSSALDYACNNDLDMLSGFPLQRTDSLSQRVVVPALYFIILSWFPLWWLRRSSGKPKPEVAIGQFLFVSNMAYQEIGGHEAVKSRIIEDVWLGFEMARHGKQQAVVDLSQVVTCRMYEGIGDLWEGFTKWIYSVTALSPWIFGLMMLGGLGFFIIPFVLIAWYFSPVLTEYDWFMLIVMQVVIIMLMRALIDHRFHYSRLYSILHPAAISFMMLSGVYGAIRAFTGTGVRWKERIYIPVSGIK